MEFYNFFTNINGHSNADASQNGFKDFPFTLDFVWILGKRYSAIHDLDDLRAAIRSKIWFSYRSGFPAIGGTGPKSDKHWGCMLRCGQMVMAEALICRHLGRGWPWCQDSPDPVYAEILKMFQDRKDCPYSIHQIAQMGVSEGKAVGQWFGPNTVAQVLRKLSIYDEWSSIAVHIAFASAVIKTDIYSLCRYVPEPVVSSPFHTYKSIWYTDCAARQCQHWQSISASTSGSGLWRPMLLFIPLRLGLSTLNPIYSRVLKNTFTMKQSLGILGGKPRHAVWFIGFTGDDLICLDPHVTQHTANLSDGKFDDSSFHLPYGGSKRMPIKDIDPSISLCFFLESQEDFEEWCSQVSKMLLLPEKQTLFEILEERPEHWPPLEFRPDLNCSNCSLDYDFVENDCNTLSEDDFENVEAASCSFKPRKKDLSL